MKILSRKPDNHNYPNELYLSPIIEFQSHNPMSKPKLPSFKEISSKLKLEKIRRETNLLLQSVMPFRGIITNPFSSNSIAYRTSLLTFYKFLFKPRRKRRRSGNDNSFHEIKVGIDKDGNQVLEKFGNAPSYKHTMKVCFAVNPNLKYSEDIVFEELQNIKLYIRSQPNGNYIFLVDEFTVKQIKRDSGDNGDEMYVHYGFQIPRHILSNVNFGEKVTYKFAVKYKERIIFSSNKFFVFAKLNESNFEPKIIPRLTKDRINFLRKQYDGKKLVKKGKFLIINQNNVSKGYFSKINVTKPKINSKSTVERHAFAEALKEYVKENFEQYPYIYHSKIFMEVEFKGGIFLHFHCTDKGHLKNRINSFKRQMNWQLIGEIVRKKRKRNDFDTILKPKKVQKVENKKILL